MTIEKQFSFILSDELRTKFFDNRIYAATMINEDEYKVTWIEDNIEENTSYPLNEVKENIHDKHWVIVNN